MAGDSDIQEKSGAFKMQEDLKMYGITPEELRKFGDNGYGSKTRI